MSPQPNELKDSCQHSTPPCAKCLSKRAAQRRYYREGRHVGKAFTREYIEEQPYFPRGVY